MAVRWAIAGTSAIADNHVIPAIKAVAGNEIVAVSSHDARRAAELAARHGIPRSYGSFEEMIQAGSMDIVYVGGANEVHAGQTIQAAQAGKHVFCEKPMATTLEAARSMIDACAANGRALGINHHLRAAARHARLKAEIENGTIGRPLGIRVTFSVLLPESVWTWRLDASRFGGVALDLGTHAADLVRWLVGSDVRRVGCISAKQVLPGTAEDSAVATLEMENGCLGQLYLSFNAPPGVLEVEVHGSRAKMVATSRLSRLPEGTVTLSNDRGDRVLEAPPVGLYEQHVRALGLAAQGDGLPLASGEDGYRSLEVGLALLEASRSGRVVELGPAVK